RDARRPVAERTAGVPAGAERSLQIRREVARLGDELGRDPHRVSIARSSAVVAPAGAIAERGIPGEPILRSGPFGDDVDRAPTGSRVEGGEGGAREVL